MPRRKVYKNFKGAGAGFKGAWKDVLHTGHMAMAAHIQALFAGIVEKTPIDTGRARGGWEITVGHKNASRTRPNSSASHVGQRLSAAEKSYSDTQLKKFLKTKARTVGLVNGQPYIRLLEYGFSDQAPAGMIRRTLNEMAEGAVYHVKYKGGTATISIRPGR